ncbi:MAG TPA: prepilin-type N-terminal cleavage/methylation domain-containing protein [Candidatus Omnitrophota bacterium]|nr:prepilin-type N-terminal cleavage/methylation domain-containing protein [Candidatus Omnitrophota bacterium]
MKKGFTLLEMLLTVLLLTVGMTSILHMVSRAIFADTNLENITTARYLGQEKMEEIKGAAAYDDIDSYASARAALTGAFSGFDRAVAVSGDPKQVDVTVYWTTQGQDQSLRLVTLFADYDY